MSSRLAVPLGSLPAILAVVAWFDMQAGNPTAAQAHFVTCVDNVRVDG